MWDRDTLPKGSKFEPGTRLAVILSNSVPEG